MDLSLTSLPAQLVTILVLGTGTAYWLGYGVSRMLLPGELLPYRWLLMPVVGLCFFAPVAQPLAWLGVNTSRLILILFLLSLVANLVARWRAPRATVQIPRREIYTPALVAIGAIALGLLPLFAYGYITVTGYNVDGSSYVAQAEFAKQFGLDTTRLASIPSIYAETVVYVIETGTGSIGPLWVSVVSELWGRDSLYAYTPLLVLAYGTSFLSVFVLYRIVFQLKFWVALVALVALSFNSVYLLIPLDNFAPHTFALALLPFELTTVYLYLTTRSWRALVVAALALDAQLLTYPEILPFYLAPVLLALGLKVAFARENIRREVVGLVYIGGLSVLLAPTAYWTLYAGLLHQAGTVTRAVGGTIETFISLGEGLGVDALRVVQLDTPVLWEGGVRAGWDTAAPVAVGILLVLMAVGLVASVKRKVWWLAACGLVYCALLAGMFFVQNYPYGFFKTFATGMFVFVAWMALGGQAWWEAMKGSEMGRRFLFAPIAVLLLLLTLLGTSMAWFETALAVRSPPVTRKLLQLSNSNLIPTNASIYLSLTNNSNPRLYWAAYLLRHHPLFGNGTVAYSKLENAREGVVYDFALLKGDENPVEFDYAPDAKVWEDRWTALYQRR